jgi:uncharacterized protein YbaR (Trm112 family)
MRKLLVLAAVACGAAVWWWRRSSSSGGAGDQWSSPEAAPAAYEPPKLGGDVDAELLAILACPLDKHAVTRQGNYLVCGECQRHYPIRDGIPVMLIDEALTPEQAAAAPA